MTSKKSFPSLKGFWINISENGKDQLYPSHCTNSDYTEDCTVSANGKEITFRNTCRIALLETKQEKDWAFHSLGNKRLSYDVFLGNVPKGHYFAFYSCQLTKGEGYKDVSCWDSRMELDFMMTNQFVWLTSYHQQNDRVGGCCMGLGGLGGLGGKHRSFQSHSGKQPTELFGPKKWIDTTRPFRVIHHHLPNKVRLEIHQEERVIWDEYFDDIYWKQVEKEIKEKPQTLILSLYYSGSGMSWLDGHVSSSKDRMDQPPSSSTIWATISNICLDDIHHVGDVELQSSKDEEKSFIIPSSSRTHCPHCQRSLCG